MLNFLILIIIRPHTDVKSNCTRNYSIQIPTKENMQRNICI